jgi:hypothetical protein
MSQGTSSKLPTPAKAENHTEKNVGWAQRQRRMRLLVRAWIRYGGDLERAKAEMRMSPEEMEEWSKDPWFQKNQENAIEMMEEGIAMNLFEMAMKQNARTLPAAKVLLPALNKYRYNQGVQKQETANEGISELLNLVSKKPMNHHESVRLLNAGPIPMNEKQELLEVIDVTPLDLSQDGIPTLEQTIENAKAAGNFKEVGGIVEDADLVVPE